MKTIFVNPSLPCGNDGSIQAVNLSVRPTDRSSYMPPLSPAICKAPDLSSIESEIGMPPEKCYPPLTFQPVGRRVYATATPGRVLNGDADYTHWTGPIAESDVQAMRSDISAAYRYLSDMARREEHYVQPVMVWYRVLDADSHELFRSSPVLVGCGVSGASPMTASVSDRNSAGAKMSGFKLELDGFRIGMSVGEGDEAANYADASSLEVMVTPMLPVLSYAADADVNFSRDADGEAVLVAAISHSPYFSTLVPSLLDRLDEVSDIAVRFQRPFSGGIPNGSVLTLSVPRRMSVVSDAEQLYRNLNKKISAVAPILYETNLPNGFVPNTSVRIADMMVCGGILPVHSKAPRITDLMEHSSSGEKWTGLVKVTVACADGVEETLTTIDSGLSGMPDKLSPLLVYPLASAVRMQIQITGADTGLRRTFDFPLRPTPCGRMAYCLNDGLRPTEIASGMTDALALVPSERPVATVREGTLAVALLSDPRRLTSTIDVCKGKIVAVTPASKSSSAWDFGRRHLYAFSTDGIYSVSVNSSCSLMSAHLIASLPVLSGTRVASTPYGVYFLSGGSLWRVSGSKTERILANVGADALTWNDAADELWCHVEGDSWIVVLSDGSCRESDLSVPGHVEWRRRIALDGINPRALRRMQWMVPCSDVSINMTISGDNGEPACGVPLVAVRVEGAVMSPVRCAVVARPFRYLTVAFSGKVADDFEFSGVILGLAD